MHTQVHHRGWIYTFSLYHDNGAILGPDEIESQLRRIVQVFADIRK